MASILYQELKDELIDRLQHKVDAQIITEQQRQLLVAPQRLAKATSQALLKFCLIADASSIPDLVDELTPSSVRTYKNVNAYGWPEEIFAEREDFGILFLLLDDEEMAWNQAIDKESVEYRANSLMYGRDDHCFAVDEFKKRFYVPDCVTLKLQVVRIPHSVRSADQEEYRGATLQITAGAAGAGDIQLSDGTNDVTATLDGTETAAQAATKLHDAINAATTFYYDAVALSGDTFTLAHRYDMPLDKDLDPAFTDPGGTSVTATINDIGTYRLPVGLSYLDDMAEEATRALLSIDLGQAAQRVTDSETDQATA